MIILYIEYRNNKLEKMCNDIKKATRELGSVSGNKLLQRVAEIKAAPSLDVMVRFRIGRCHALEGNLKGKYALDLEHPYRLIIEPVITEDPCSGSMDLSQITIVQIMEVRDYHGK
ncbi:MAG: plasmid maintenance system killer protein [Bacillota bacterium]